MIFGETANMTKLTTFKIQIINPFVDLPLLSFRKILVRALQIENSQRGIRGAQIVK